MEEDLLAPTYGELTEAVALYSMLDKDEPELGAHAICAGVVERCGMTEESIID